MSNLKPEPPVFISTDTVFDRLKKNREYCEQLEEWSIVNLPFVDVLKKEDFRTFEEYNEWKKVFVEFLEKYDLNKKQRNRRLLNSTRRCLKHIDLFKISIVFVLFGFLCVFYDYSCSVKTQSENGRYSISSTSFGAIVLDNKNGDAYDADGTLMTRSPKKQ